MPRKPNSSCNLSWEERYGTVSGTTGNLPKYKVNDNSCNIDLNNISYPGIRISDFHYHHIKCPYSIQANVHYIRNMSINSNDYFKLEKLPDNSIADHSNTYGIMIRESNGSKHGWLCVDDTCPHYLLTGQRYFYR